MAGRSVHSDTYKTRCVLEVLQGASGATCTLWNLLDQVCGQVFQGVKVGRWQPRHDVLHLLHHL